MIHLSVGDGWWQEGHRGTNGWLIDGGVDRQEEDADAAEAEALYRLLEENVVPSFYDRDGKGVSKRWLAMVKEAIRTVAPLFGTRRMVKQYVREMYAPLLSRQSEFRTAR